MNLIPELKHAIRALAKRPGFSMAVASTLALGLGLNVTVLALLDALLLRPVQLPNHERVVVLRDAPRGGTRGESVAPANFFDWRAEAKSLQRVVAWKAWDSNAAAEGAPEPVAGARVSAEFFAALGAPPARGRGFTHEDELPGNDRQVVISHHFWRRAFAANPAAVGMHLRLDGEPYMIVGIAPERFSFPAGTELWAPLAFAPEHARDRTNRSLNVAGELAPGRSIDDARAELQLLSQRLERDYPATNRDRGILVQSLTEAYREKGTGTVVALLHVGAGFVLLVAAANIAGLLLARGLDRRHELAVRVALGASRAQIARLLVTETVVLGLAASVLAVLFASGALATMRASMPADLGRHIEGWENLRLSGVVVALMPVFAIGVGLLVGVLPALSASRSALGESVRTGSRTITGGRSRQRARRLLVVIEIASALVLVITSALIFAGGRRLAIQASGFDSDNLLVVDVRLPQKTYDTPEAQRNLSTRLIDEVAHLPAVESVALASVLPASGWSPESVMAVEGEPELESAQRPQAGYRIVSSGYFETMRIPVRGRDFSAMDRPSSEPVAIISATMAQRHWPGQDPIGRRVRMERFGNEWLTIVGVAGDTRMFNWWDGEENLSAVYVPLEQRPFGGTMQLAVRMLTNPVSVSGSARNALSAINPLFALRARTMQQAIADCGLGLTYLATLLAVCSGVALVLSIIGIYSLMAYEVSQRTHEFGVRMALGATSSRVLRMTLGQAGIVTLLGILAGVALAFALTEVIASALVGIVSPDPSLFLAASAGLATVSLIAAWLPAHRATKVDPLIALRAE